MEGSGCDVILRYYPSIYLEGLVKTTKNLSQDSRSSDRNVNPGRYIVFILDIAVH
jgi:hypothetical protein